MSELLCEGTVNMIDEFCSRFGKSGLIKKVSVRSRKNNSPRVDIVASTPQLKELAGNLFFMHVYSPMAVSLDKRPDFEYRVFGLDENIDYPGFPPARREDLYCSSN